MRAVSPSQGQDSGEPKKRCEHCGQELEDDEVYELDGVALCWDCFSEEEDLRGIKEEWVE